MEKLSQNQKRQICPPKCPKTYPEPKIALKLGTRDLIMMIRDKNNVFDKVKNNHADLAWKYPGIVYKYLSHKHGKSRKEQMNKGIEAGSAENVDEAKGLVGSLPGRGREVKKN